MKSVTTPFCWNEKTCWPRLLCWQYSIKISKPTGVWPRGAGWGASALMTLTSEPRLRPPPLPISWLRSWQKLRHDIDVTWLPGLWYVACWLWVLKRAAQTGALCTLCHTLRTQYLSYVTSRGFEVTDMCLIATPPLEAWFPRYFPTLLSLNIPVRWKKSFCSSELDFLCAGLDSLCRSLIYLIAINWCSTRFKQQDGPTLAFFQCADVRGNKNRISLSSTVRTGAIKGLRLVAMELWLEPRNT